MAEKSLGKGFNQNSHGSVKGMENLNMYKQYIGNFYLEKLNCQTLNRKRGLTR